MSIVNFNWRLALFSACFLVLFLSLGTWQLQRSEEKTEMLAAAAANSEQPGVILGPGVEVENGDPVRVRGRFDPTRVFLLDNRVFEGKVGYEVLQVFITKKESGVLVNRGFLQGERTRDLMPEIPTVSADEQLIRGHAYLTEMPVPANNVSGVESPWVIQVAAPKRLSDVAGMTLFGHTVRLETGHPAALPRFWPVTIMSPERHMGYAVTWFVMALAVMVAFIVSLRSDREESHE